jgi:hypothetical protein
MDAADSVVSERRVGERLVDVDLARVHPYPLLASARPRCGHDAAAMSRHPASVPCLHARQRVCRHGVRRQDTEVSDFIGRQEPVLELDPGWSQRRRRIEAAFHQKETAIDGFAEHLEPQSADAPDGEHLPSAAGDRSWPPATSRDGIADCGISPLAVWRGRPRSAQ